MGAPEEDLLFLAASTLTRPHSLESRFDVAYMVYTCRGFRGHSHKQRRSSGAVQHRKHFQHVPKKRSWCYQTWRGMRSSMRLLLHRVGRASATNITRRGQLNNIAHMCQTHVENPHTPKTGKIGSNEPSRHHASTAVCYGACIRILQGLLWCQEPTAAAFDISKKRDRFARTLTKKFPKASSLPLGSTNL